MKSISANFRSLVLGFVIALLLAGLATAAEVKVMISGGLTAAYNALVPEFERLTGNKVITAYGPSMGTTVNAIPVRLERGERELLALIVEGKRDVAIASSLGIPERSVAVLWATHLCEEVAGADRVVVLHRGKVLADTTPAELIASSGKATIEQAFLSMTGGGKPPG